MKILPHDNMVACKVEFKLTILFNAIKNNCLFGDKGLSGVIFGYAFRFKFAFSVMPDMCVVSYTPFEHIKGGFVRFMLLAICLADRWVVERE